MLNTNFAFINFYYEYLLLLFAQISNQLMKIQKQPRLLLSTDFIGAKFTLWIMVERSVYNILHGRKSEEQGRKSAGNLGGGAANRRKATETKGLVNNNFSTKFTIVLLLVKNTIPQIEYN